MVQLRRHWKPAEAHLAWKAPSLKNSASASFFRNATAKYCTHESFSSYVSTVTLAPHQAAAQAAPRRHLHFPQLQAAVAGIQCSCAAALWPRRAPPRNRGSSARAARTRSPPRQDSPDGSPSSRPGVTRSQDSPDSSRRQPRPVVPLGLARR
jgi:hypothetical protein